MNSRDMINLIVDIERTQHGIKKWYPSRIRYFQTTHRFDDHTYEVSYDGAFENWIRDLENALGGKIYRPTAKKILNNWYAWSREQRTALLNVRNRLNRNQII